MTLASCFHPVHRPTRWECLGDCRFESCSMVVKVEVEPATNCPRAYEHLVDCLHRYCSLAWPSDRVAYSGYCPSQHQSPAARRQESSAAAEALKGREIAVAELANRRYLKYKNHESSIGLRLLSVRNMSYTSMGPHTSF